MEVGEHMEYFLMRVAAPPQIPRSPFPKLLSNSFLGVAIPTLAGGHAQQLSLLFSINSYLAWAVQYGMADEVARNRNTLEQTSARGLRSVPFAFIEAFGH